MLSKVEPKNLDACLRDSSERKDAKRTNRRNFAREERSRSVSQDFAEFAAGLPVAAGAVSFAVVPEVVATAFFVPVLAAGAGVG